MPICNVSLQVIPNVPGKKLYSTVDKVIELIKSSAVMLEYVHEEIRPYKWWARGVIYMTLILSIEYFTGYFLDYLVGACPWDYTGNSLSVKGYIRLDYAPVWFGAGLLFEQIHDNVVKKWLR